VDAIYGAYVNAGSVLGANAWFGDNVCHRSVA
jgi:hypothetical protein